MFDSLWKFIKKVTNCDWFKWSKWYDSLWQASRHCSIDTLCWLNILQQLAEVIGRRCFLPLLQQKGCLGSQGQIAPTFSIPSSLVSILLWGQRSGCIGMSLFAEKCLLILLSGVETCSIICYYNYNCLPKMINYKSVGNVTRKGFFNI